MTRDDIVRRLAEHRAALDALTVRELLLFGSFARNDASPGSDLDFVVEFHQKSFDHYMGLKELLEQLFDRPVDLVLKSAIKARLRDRILREAIRAA
jgi:predicted nucleotidyltransferase